LAVVSAWAIDALRLMARAKVALDLTFRQVNMMLRITAVDNGWFNNGLIENFMVGVNLQIICSF